MFGDCILFNSKRLERLLTTIAEEEFANIGLHHSYGYILSVISEYEYVKTKTISCELGLDSSTVTRMVAKLEKEGLVRKGSENSPVEISLTTEGQALMPEIKQAWKCYHKRIDLLLGTTEQQRLLEILSNTNKKLYSK